MLRCYAVLNMKTYFVKYLAQRNSIVIIPSLNCNLERGNRAPARWGEFKIEAEQHPNKENEPSPDQFRVLLMFCSSSVARDSSFVGMTTGD